MSQKENLPPRCTCSRLIWLGQNCKKFNLKVDGKNFEIWAEMEGEDAFYGSSGPIESLGATVGECFAVMWES